jgi:bifunctional DNA-binding transcriptional regulator/antitoxin component of YhaV-PrlF toxin-antitoxin module
MAFGIAKGTTVKIDKAGRIVLPKAIRERLRLREWLGVAAAGN